MASVPEKPTVAVIGLGYAGIIVAHSLLASGKAHVVGIDRGSAFFHRIGSPLAVVDKAFAEKLRLPYAAMFQGADGEFVQGTVERIEEHRVVLADGRTVAFDYAVIATGSTYNGTIDPPAHDADAIVAFFRRYQEALAKAKSVLVVGGGPAGIEYAGFVATAFPKVKVTLVDGGTELLASAVGSSPKFRADLTKKLAALGVELVFNELLSLPPHEELSMPATRTLTSKVTGRQYTSDVQILATGYVKLNSEPLQAAPWAARLSKAGLKVNEFLQVEGVPHVFAAGDIADVRGPNGTVTKMAAQARMQAELISENMAKLLDARAVGGTASAAALKPFTSTHFVMFGAVAKGIGTVQGMPGAQWVLTGTLGNWMASMKTKDFMLSMLILPNMAPVAGSPTQKKGGVAVPLVVGSVCAAALYGLYALVKMPLVRM